MKNPHLSYTYMCSLIILLHGNIIQVHLLGFVRLMKSGDLMHLHVNIIFCIILNVLGMIFISVSHIYVEEQIYSVVCTLKNCNDSKGDKWCKLLSRIEKADYVLIFFFNLILNIYLLVHAYICNTHLSVVFLHCSFVCLFCILGFCCCCFLFVYI